MRLKRMIHRPPPGIPVRGPPSAAAVVALRPLYRGVHQGGTTTNMTDVSPKGSGGLTVPLPAVSPADSDCNSNPCNTTSCDDGDFVQDNQDYQWFLEYGYRGESFHHHASVLSSLTESYGLGEGMHEFGYYDALAKDLDANLAEADMESFRTEDIHSLLTTLPAMCTDLQMPQEINRQGEMYASMTGSMMAKFDLDSAFSPHSSSQGEDSTGSVGTMSICKSELLFSPVKEVPAVNYSVDSLDCSSLQQDIMLTCQANKDNYTIAFEGSMSGDSDYHYPGLDKSDITCSNHGWPHGMQKPTTENKKPIHKTIALETSMAKSDSGFTTWSKLKKRSSEAALGLRRHPSGNNNTTLMSADSTEKTGFSSLVTSKSQSLPNLAPQACGKQGIRSGSIMSNSSTDSQRLGYVRVFDVQHSGGPSDTTSSCSTSSGGSLNLVKRFIKHKSMENSAENGTVEPHKQSHHINNWLPPEETTSEYSTLEDSLVGHKTVNVTYRKHDLIEEETEDRSEMSESVEQISETSSKLESLEFGVSYTIENPTIKRSPNNLFNINNNNSVERSDLRLSRNTRTFGSSDDSPSISVCSSSDGTDTTKLQRLSRVHALRKNSRLQAVDRSIQTSVMSDASITSNISKRSATQNVKVIEASFLSKLKDGDTQKPIYVLYPNYTLPNLDFLSNKKDELAKVLLMPQQYKLDNTEKHETKTRSARRPFSCTDMESLKKKGFSHVRDWDSLTFLLPAEYRQVLAQMPEVAHQIKTREDDLMQKEKLTKKTRPVSCDATNMTNVSSSSSTATQPSSGYRGSSTMLLTDSAQNSPAPANHFNPLFVYRYDSVTSSEASLLASERQRSNVPPLPKRSVSLPDEQTPPRPPLPKSILRKSLERCKTRKNQTNKRYSMFDVSNSESTEDEAVMKRRSLQDFHSKTDEEYDDEGVETDNSVEDQIKRADMRPPTPPLPKQTDSGSGYSTVGQDELHQLEEFLEQSGISCSDSDDWGDRDLIQLRSHVSKFLALNINHDRQGGRKAVSFSDKICVYTQEEEHRGAFQGRPIVDMPICEEGESSPEHRASPPTEANVITIMRPIPYDLTQKRTLISAVTDSVEQIINHFSPAVNQSELAELGDSTLTPACGRLVLSTLCPSLYAVLSDGLRPSLETSFGAINNSVWQVVEACAQQGPLTKSLNELVMRINSEDVITEGLVKFNAFVIGLLNVRSLDAWASYVRTRESILRKHYTSDSLLLMTHTGGSAIRALLDTLVASLEPLSMLPFKLDLMFEYRQLHQSLKRMGSFQQPLSPSHCKTSLSPTQLSSKQWKLVKLVQSLQNEEVDVAVLRHFHSDNSTDPSLTELLDSSAHARPQFRDERCRPRSCLEPTVSGPDSESSNGYSLISDVTTTVKKRWSGVQPGSKLSQAFNRLMAAEDTEEEYTDSLEHAVNQRLNGNTETEYSSSLPEDSSSSNEKPTTGKFRRLQMKWEMLSGKETGTSESVSPVESPVHTPGSTGSNSSVKSRIPRPVTSPVKPSGIPLPSSQTKLKKPVSSIPKSNMPINPVKPPMRKPALTTTSRTSRVDQPTASEARPKVHAARPSSLPYRPTDGQTGKNSKLTPPRRAVSSSLPRSPNKQQQKKVPKVVRTVIHRLPSDAGHLTFNEGEKLKVILEVDAKWLLCCRGNQKGLVPRSAVIAATDGF